MIDMPRTIILSDEVYNDLMLVKGIHSARSLSAAVRTLMDRAGYNTAFFERIRSKEAEA